VLAALYARTSRRGVVVPEAAMGPSPAEDPANIVIRLLDSARGAYAEKKLSEAYGFAGQALRLVISTRYGTGGEMTNAEAIRLIRDTYPDLSRQVEEIISRCSDIGFAKGEEREGEFPRFIRTIRDIADRDLRGRQELPGMEKS